MSHFNEALPQTDKIYLTVANRHDGQAFAVAPSAGSPSGDKCNRNVATSPVGQALCN